MLWLITGPAGCGKTYFLKSLSDGFHDCYLADDCSIADAEAREYDFARALGVGQVVVLAFAANVDLISVRVLAERWAEHYRVQILHPVPFYPFSSL